MANEIDWPTDSMAQGASPGLDLKRVLWGRKWLLVFFAALGAAGGYLQFTKTPPKYRSTAQVLVNRQLPKLQMNQINDLLSNKDPLDTHVQLMSTPIILGPAVQLGRLDELPSMKNAGDPTAVLAEGLLVYRSDGSPEILEMSYKCGNRADCQAVLNAVIEAYQEFLGESHQKLSDKMIEFITKAKDDLLVTLNEKEEAYQKFRDTASLLWEGQVGINYHQQRMAQIEVERSQLRIRQSQVKAELDAFEAALSRGTSRQVLLMMAEKMKRQDDDGKSPANANPLGELLPLLIEEALLKEKLGANHPKVREITKQIELTRTLLQQQAGEVVRPVASTDLLTMYVDSLRQEIKTNDAKISELDRLFAEEQERAVAMGGQENQNRVMREEIDRIKALYDTIVNQLAEISLVKDNEAISAQVVKPPSPAEQIEPNQKICLGMGGVIGALVGIGISFLLEVTDKSFRSPEDIFRQLRLPVIGHVPRLDLERGARVVKDKVLDRSLAVYHRPKSRVAEAFRGIRTALLFGAKGKNVRVVQITSPDPGDGKSTLSANTAIALANSGKRVLLIDADLRKPRQHKLFGVNRNVGVSSVLAEEMDLADATRGTPVANLDLLTAGPKSDHPGELILDPKFEQMVEMARTKYDLVVIDSPPVLAVTDATAIAPLADGVILAFRINKRSRAHASQARETLEMIGAKLLGVVVNGMSDQIHYSYGSGGNYGYGMHYGYGSRYYYDGDDYFETGRSSKASAGIVGMPPRTGPERPRPDNGV